MKKYLIPALCASVAANALLGIVLYQVLQSRGGKPLPSQKPDFAAVEAELSRQLAEPEVAKVIRLEKFVAKDWICMAVLIHKEKNMGPHWQRISQLVEEVSSKCKIPGRTSGRVELADPQDPRRMTGTTIEFGYSPEVGYRHPNEFTATERVKVIQAVSLSAGVTKKPETLNSPKELTP